MKFEEYTDLCMYKYTYTRISMYLRIPSCISTSYNITVSDSYAHRIFQFSSLVKSLFKNILKHGFVI